MHNDKDTQMLTEAYGQLIKEYGKDKIDYLAGDEDLPRMAGQSREDALDRATGNKQSSPSDTFQRDTDDYTFGEIRNNLTTLANQAINLSEPENYEQAKDNLIALGRLINSMVERNNLSLEWGGNIKNDSQEENNT